MELFSIGSAFTFSASFPSPLLIPIPSVSSLLHPDTPIDNKAHRHIIKQILFFITNNDLIFKYYFANLNNFFGQTTDNFFLLI
jgi:hypothetical protein